MDNVRNAPDVHDAGDVPASDDPVGVPCWVDHVSRSSESARKFYSALLGWDYTGEGDTVGVVNDQLVCGIAEPVDELASVLPAYWHPYFRIDSFTEVAFRAPAEGDLLWGPKEYGDGLASVATLRDPAGATFSLWQPEALEGFAPGGPGAPVWFELVTRKSASVAEFYSAVFDCRPALIDGSGGPYRVLSRGGGELLAGVVIADVEPYWRVYFQVDDLDEMAQAVEELGGSIESDVVDVPIGRTILARDSMGALFGILQPWTGNAADTRATPPSVGATETDDNAGYPTGLSL